MNMNKDYQRIEKAINFPGQNYFSRSRNSSAEINLNVGGTNFQLKVWQALLKIAFGQVVSYGRIAQAINSPMTTRAVGSAVGKNPISILIPCHRVIQSTGIIGNYRWGARRKKANLTPYARR